MKNANKIDIIGRYIVNVGKIPLRFSGFIRTLTGAQNDVISNYCDEFDVKTKSYSLSDYHRALYVITRILKPEKLIETGVFEGHSSLAILIALKENKRGYLYSIDLPSQKLPLGKKPGWIVPDNLRMRWDLRRGKSSDLLPDLLEEVREVDIFLHDSEHSYETMSWEYQTAWYYIRNGGLLLSHDVSQNLAFRTFSKRAGVYYYYMLGNLGGIKRTI